MDIDIDTSHHLFRFPILLTFVCVCVYILSYAWVCVYTYTQVYVYSQDRQQFHHYKNPSCWPFITPFIPFPHPTSSLVLSSGMLLISPPFIKFCHFKMLNKLNHTASDLLGLAFFFFLSMVYTYYDLTIYRWISGLILVSGYYE